jgi:hypothetical protein
MIALAALILVGATMAPASPSPQIPSTSQAFTDRAARLEARITEDQQRALLAPGQDALLRVELDATRRAYAARDPAANEMLDVIDRQLAELDHQLSRAEDGRGITVHVGDSVLVALYDPYVWNIENSDQTVLAPKIGIMWMRGVQGGFTAKQPGTAILSLTPRESVPAGVKTPVVFTITVLPRA